MISDCVAGAGGGGPSVPDSDNKRRNFPDLVKLPDPAPAPGPSSDSQADIKFGNIAELLEDTDQHNIGKKPRKYNFHPSLDFQDIVILCMTTTSPRTAAPILGRFQMVKLNDEHLAIDI